MTTPRKIRGKTPPLFALLLSAALTACSGGSDPSRTGDTGLAAFPLAATSASGKVYRLRGAVIDVQGGQSRAIEGPVDPADPQITTTASLPAGDYQFSLRDGWTMYQVPPDGAPVPVPAQLISPNPIAVKIVSGRDAPVTFHFMVGGEMIPPGSATVGISVDEPTDAPAGEELPPLPDPSTVPVIIKPNTRVADEEMRAALTAYSPDSGTLRFAHSTPVLAGVRVGDVIVSEPSAAAPAGYLRKVVSVTVEGNEVVLETTQAALTDAIEQGAVAGKADLGPGRVLRTEVAVEGVTIGPVLPEGPVEIGDGAAGEGGEELLALGLGDSYDFQARFDHAFIPMAGGSGKIEVNGSIAFHAGYGIDVGIKACWELPPICVNSFRASVGFQQHADLSIVGTAWGTLGEEAQLATQIFEPQVFFIGPVPVVVVPRLTLYLTGGGQVEARVTFNAHEQIDAELGAEWTSKNGWRNFGPPTIDATVDDVSFYGSVKPRAAAKTAMSLKLYDVVGPEVSLEAGAELDGHVPRNPSWLVNGFLVGKLGFRIEVPIIGTLASYETTLFNLSRELDRGVNTKPVIALADRVTPAKDIQSAKVGPLESAILGVDLRQPVDFTPGCPGMLGGGFFFAAYDAEDGCLDATIVSDVDGQLPSYHHTFTTVGVRHLTVTVRDSQGLTATERFTLNVMNSMPAITVLAPSDSAEIYQNEEVIFSAQITDPNEADAMRLCANMVWTFDQPDARSVKGCRVAVTFTSVGTRNGRVTTVDSDGAVGTKTLTVTVKPARDNPVNVKGVVYRRDKGDQQEVICLPGGLCCMETDTTAAPAIDLTQAGCGAPNAYVAEAEIMNPPKNETFTYEWSMRGGGGNELFARSSASSRFELIDPGNQLPVTEDCTVTLGIKASDSAHNKAPFVVWQGKCTYHAHTVR
jgi:hypothetical protein